MKQSRASLGRRLERLEEVAGVGACRICSAWADVILLESPGARRSGPRSAAWGPWRGHEGRCPACGREPAVHVVTTAIPL